MKTSIRPFSLTGALLAAFALFAVGGLAKGIASQAAEAAHLSTAVTNASQAAPSTQAIKPSQAGSQAEKPLASAPQRVSLAVIPARVAFTNNRHLWIIDGSQADAPPKQVTTQGLAEIVGWSADGQWLLYLQHSTEEANQSPAMLWAVRADGSGAFQVDTQPVVGEPRWSPTGQRIAYLTADPKKENRLVVTVARLENHKASITHPANQLEATDAVWTQDGEHLLVATPAAKDQPIQINRIDLAGKVQDSFPIGGKPNVAEGIYPYGIKGMTLSPNGHDLAYFRFVNSASLSADSVAIQLLDLRHPQKQVDLGEGLGYPEWFAWSPDSTRLAYVEGEGRDATRNKQVAVVDLPNNFAITHLGQKGTIDQMPAWSAVSGGTLYYTHGKETGAAMSGHFEPEKVLVPGQRIWQRTADGKQQAVTQGTDKTADYFPAVTNDGKHMLFLRLDAAEHGSLFLKTDGRKETEWLRNVTGDIGYYGNYLPRWFSVYWGK